MWIVWPQSEHVDIWHATRLLAPSVTLHDGDTLDGEDVIPGFSYPVSEVFVDPLMPLIESPAKYEPIPG